MTNNKTLICRITHFDNLDGILRRKGIYAPKFQPNDGIGFKEIHHVGIQSQRAVTKVTCGPCGYIHDYVPFYFSPRSPMLYAIYKNNVDGYNEGQKPVIYICSYAETIEQQGGCFVFTDGHAIMAPLTHFYDDLKDLNKLHWDIIRGKYWFDNEKYPDRKRRRQAEFLVHKFFPLKCIVEIIVFDKDMEKLVNLKLNEHNIKLPVKTDRKWYY